ncbi:MAG: winged helix-turn-helix transcriptional regulator [Actinobacteria bacterium]|nr:winged helix-turn-helix transcriptional regulator [Actinomycetota bacterium]
MHMRLNGELSRLLAADSELSYQDYSVLVALTDAPEGTMRMFELGRMLGWEKSRVSHQITRMTARGLVRKRRCGGDRRGAFVTVTARGRKELAAAAPGHVDAVRRLFIDRLTPRQLDQIASAAERILAAIDEACDGSAPDPAGGGDR